MVWYKGKSTHIAFVRIDGRHYAKLGSALIISGRLTRFDIVWNNNRPSIGSASRIIGHTTMIVVRDE